jgi:hypothetical protein
VLSPLNSEFDICDSNYTHSARISFPYDIIYLLINKLICLRVTYVRDAKTNGLGQARTETFQVPDVFREWLRTLYRKRARDQTARHLIFCTLGTP